MNNLPLPFPSTFDDVDSLSNWMNDYQEFYNSHIENEKARRNFTFELVRFINELTFALEKEGMGPRTQRAVDEVLEYLRSRDKDSGKPLMRHFEVKWETHSSVQVRAETEQEAIQQAIVLAEEEPGRVDRHFHGSKITAEEVGA